MMYLQAVHAIQSLGLGQPGLVTVLREQARSQGLFSVSISLVSVYDLGNE